MAIAIDLAFSSYKEGNRFNSCLLYDPKEDKVLISVGDETKRITYNIQHCVMNLMREFSKSYLFN